MSRRTGCTRRSIRATVADAAPGFARHAVEGLMHEALWFPPANCRGVAPAPRSQASVGLRGSKKTICDRKKKRRPPLRSFGGKAKSPSRTGSKLEWPGKGFSVWDEPAIDAQDPESLLTIDEALTKLAEWDARQARVVELRFFGGLSVEETAAVLRISPETVMRDWKLARTWLRRELRR